jgi:hypothetical protein
MIASWWQSDAAAATTSCWSQHRLEGFRLLDREHIPCLITSMTGAEARMWEIAENLHRAELTVLERSDQIAEWIRLCDEARKPAQVAPFQEARFRPNLGQNLKAAVPRPG